MSSEITSSNERKVVGQIVLNSIEILEKNLPGKAKGVSIKGIRKNIEDNYDVEDPKSFGNIIKLFLKKSFEKGLLMGIKCKKNGYYMISNATQCKKNHH
ncbi:hypothetical protein PVAND_001048 [Polypedilum vanderplanki]|uniref:H15 domain-containing protein n=1 Tax=Polypedilum vanderplanki TaxID=319348 RepID=A0A9J6BM19_POLVA|nr:hypothetical protein PVAND_001048 [Polypedilum vanderplanki]